MKHLIWIILIIIVFCLGVQLGELKSEARGFHFGCGGRMMDWEYKNVKPFTGEFPVSPTAPNPETKQ